MSSNILHKNLTNEDLPIKIEHDMKYKGMYRLVWADKMVSEDCYNLSRANDILNNYAEYRKHMLIPNPTWLTKRAFQCEL